MGQASERIEVADALRGVAVAGIILYHAVESFNAFYPDARFTLACDEDVFGIATLLLSGKMYGIFALLFGLTFHIMLSRSMSRWRFAWRMVLLFVIGMVNIAVYDGDILTSYALCGLLLILCSRLSNRWLWVLTVLVLAQPFELWQLLSGWTMPSDWIWSDYALLAQHHQESGFWQNVVMNVRYAFVANMGYFTFTGRLTQTFGLFLLGLLFGRTRMFCNEGQNLLVWKLILVAGCLVIGVWSMWSPLLSNQQCTGMHLRPDEPKQLSAAVGDRMFPFLRLRLGTLLCFRAYLCDTCGCGYGDISDCRYLPLGSPPPAWSCRGAVEEGDVHGSKSLISDPTPIESGAISCYGYAACAHAHTY